MAPSMMACSKMERNGARARTSGPTNRFTLATGWTTILKERASTDGQMEGFTMDNGKRISFMERASTPGPMEENMKASIRMIRNTVSVPITGLTAKLMKVNGLAASNTEKPDSPTQRVGASLAYGKTANALSGWTRRAPCDLEVRSLKTLRRVVLAVL